MKKNFIYATKKYIDDRKETKSNNDNVNTNYSFIIFIYAFHSFSIIITIIAFIKK